jgi:hypothetical protein
MTTIEVRHPGVRQGIGVDLHECTHAQVEECVRSAAFMASGFEPEHRRVNDPGWWAALVCSAGLHLRMYASVQRTFERHDTHALLTVERGSMLELYPVWPVLSLGSRHVLDLRPESVLREGPTNLDLDAYVKRFDVEGVTHTDLRRAFDAEMIGFSREADAFGRFLIAPIV